MKKSVTPLFNGMINYGFIVSFFAIASLTALTFFLINSKEEKLVEDEEDFVALYI